MVDWAVEASKNMKSNGVGIAPNGLYFQFNKQLDRTYRYFPFIP